MKSQYEAFLEEVEAALGKATSSESLVLLDDFNAHVDKCTIQPGKVLLGNMVTLTIIKTQGVYCSSVPPMGCA